MKLIKKMEPVTKMGNHTESSHRILALQKISRLQAGVNCQKAVTKAPLQATAYSKSTNHLALALVDAAKQDFNRGERTHGYSVSVHIVGNKARHFPANVNGVDLPFDIVLIVIDGQNKGVI